MEHRDARNIMEALLFITEQPVPGKAFVELFDQQFSAEEVKRWRKRFPPSMKSAGARLSCAKSRAAGSFPQARVWSLDPKIVQGPVKLPFELLRHETLSIIAYKQPITRSEMEEIRGVEVSAVLDTLLERRLVRIVAARKPSAGPFSTAPRRIS